MGNIFNDSVEYLYGKPLLEESPGLITERNFANIEDKIENKFGTIYHQTESIREELFNHSTELFNIKLEVDEIKKQLQGQRAMLIKNELETGALKLKIQNLEQQEKDIETIKQALSFIAALTIGIFIYLCIL